MTDEEYVFNQTAYERKRNGYGDRCKKRQGGKIVRLPSDNLTAKERKELSGPVVTYELGKPISWERFNSYPATIAKEYLENIYNKYGVANAEIAEMFGVTTPTVCKKSRLLGVQRRLGKCAGKDMDGWLSFLALMDEDKTEEVTEETPEREEVRQEEVKVEVPEDVMAWATLLKALKGTGAKIHLEVTL